MCIKKQSLLGKYYGATFITFQLVLYKYEIKHTNPNEYIALTNTKHININTNSKGTNTTVVHV